MPKRLPFVLTLGALAAASAFGVTPAQAAPSDVVGHAYVNDNTAGANTVAGVRPARRRLADPDGRLAVRDRRRRRRSAASAPRARSRPRPTAGT